ncbi:GlcG/HbpS family heme-binding protein [Arthrobacter crystallopoietes]|uniref:Haem-degrading n=1 Tax=Crystallibacter crystallopoietes TaxID=37928 RepID=A0A1H1D0F6_9MICC|nr:heme-binding protein [Arthrobacter crystallopoietes]SDQ69944.1 Haem-degrading [Arthrobacter crystallopoietes]
MTSVTLTEARAIIDAAEKRAGEIGQPMNIAVVDSGGNLVSHARMDGAWIGSIDISINKAFTARAFDIQTKDLGDNSQPNQQFYGIHASNGGPDHDLRRRSAAEQGRSGRGCGRG